MCSDERDDTVLHRMMLQRLINEGVVQPEEQTWTTDQLQGDFEVQGFSAPYVVVRRKADGVMGSLMFRHSPRIYWGFKEDAP